MWPFTSSYILHLGWGRSAINRIYWSTLLHCSRLKWMNHSNKAFHSGIYIKYQMRNHTEILCVVAYRFYVVYIVDKYNLYWQFLFVGSGGCTTVQSCNGFLNWWALSIRSGDLHDYCWNEYLFINLQKQENILFCIFIRFLFIIASWLGTICFSYSFNRRHQRRSIFVLWWIGRWISISFYCFVDLEIWLILNNSLRWNALWWLHSKFAVDCGDH